jgi:glycosyltransferase involved in cell wall biosynthesis
MLSILIATYNQNITRLATELHRQAMEQYADFELIVLEDGSMLFVDENRVVNELEFCRHIILPKNTGRSAARNKLANEAKYDHLLFIDCDAEVCSDQYVSKYLSFCKEECVVIGGTAYNPAENDPRYSLRLAYGRQREARSAAERDKNNFSTFNFLISSAIFNRVRFDETIRGYGHEDLIFGHQLHQLGYEFIQIENPLIHKGLDDNETYIHKTEEATRNLLSLYRTGHYPFLAEESTLLYSFIRIYKSGLTRLCANAFGILQPFLARNLCNPSPSLRLYDLYKLLYLCKSSLTK